MERTYETYSSPNLAIVSYRAITTTTLPFAKHLYTPSAHSIFPYQAGPPCLTSTLCHNNKFIISENISVTALSKPLSDRENFVPKRSY